MPKYQINITPQDKEISQKILKEVIDHFGSQLALAKKLEVSHTAVYKWLTGEAVIPAYRAIQIEYITKGRFPTYKLRPDLIKILIEN